MHKRRKRLNFIALICALCISFTAMGISEGIHQIIAMDENVKEVDKGALYISIQHEGNPLALKNEERTLENFEQLYAKLKDGEKEYYEIYYQPLYCSDNIKGTYDAVTGELRSGCEQAKCIQVSEEVLEKFGFGLKSGRLFDSDDYTYSEEDLVPILLGNAYSGIYREGDTISGEYLYKNFKFMVVGILNKGCEIKISTGNTSLDEYIIMPSFVFESRPQSEDEYITQKIHYANKTSGIIETDDVNFSETYTDIKNILSTSNVGQYSMTCSSVEKSFLIKGINLKMSNVYLLVVSIGLFILATWCWMHYNGVNRKIVTLIIVTIFAIICAEIASFCVLYFIGLAMAVKKWPFIGGILFGVVNLIIMEIKQWRGSNVYNS